MPDPLARVAYIDDSGHQQSGLVVYGWVHFSPSHWPVVLRRWLEIRKRLYREFGIHVETELHSTDYINGRRRVTDRAPARYVHDGVTFWKDLGRDVARTLLEEISCLEGLTAGAVYRRCDPHPTASDKVGVYRAMIGRWESELAARHEYAMLFVDGDGSDANYRTAHRALKLDERRILEDPIMVQSSVSQLIQMADLVAWCAFVSIERHPAHRFAEAWYDRYISPRDPARSPVAV
ncbi:DUF3800 domain-containing protein [Microbacterium sp.]|uniref:DUF3800 domain-containing protein n=1 Tax=Microbacterium sp. TaxID=51671 RepID=UPI0039E26D9D